MATPFSQIVGTQAVENVVSGERYKNITDEIIKYALELYGKPAFPVIKTYGQDHGLAETKNYSIGDPRDISNPSKSCAGKLGRNYRMTSFGSRS